MSTVTKGWDIREGGTERLATPSKGYGMAGAVVFLLS
jgi:hypothetical protein